MRKTVSFKVLHKDTRLKIGRLKFQPSNQTFIASLTAGELAGKRLPMDIENASFGAAALNYFYDNPDEFAEWIEEEDATMHMLAARLVMDGRITLTRVD